MDDLGAIIFILFLIICGAFFGLRFYADIVTSDGTITVTEKVGAHGDEGQYLIIATTKSGALEIPDEVYTVADNWIYLKFDASDRYAALKVGKTYNIKCSGFRNHFLSWYKNIIEYQEV